MLLGVLPGLIGGFSARAGEPDPAHRAAQAAKPKAWPGGIIPYDISKLTLAQQATARLGMKRWIETGANITFVPRTTEKAYVYFTGKMDAGNNTSETGYHEGKRVDVNITAFWWQQGEWMIVHELGHVLGFFHEQQRWDRDQYVRIHYENIKPGRADDYDWIPRTNWLVSSLPYDYRSIMHYRICWAGRCESECKDGVGSSPCAVIQPLDTNYDQVIGQWGENKVSALDAVRAQLAYGVKTNGTGEIKP